MIRKIQQKERPMKKFLALTLAFVMVLSVCLFAGCDEKPADTTTKKPADSVETTTSDKNTTENPTTPADTTTEPDAPIDTTTEEPDAPIEPEVFDGTGRLPGYEDVDFRGKTFVIAGYTGCADGFDNVREIYSEDTDAIAVAVRERNQYVEHLYNCTIEVNGSDNPAGLVSAEVTSGKHSIDIFSQKYAVGTAATSGANYNLYSLGIDFTQNWWDQNYVKTNTVKNSAGVDTLYSIVGDFSFSASSLAHAIMFNKNVYETTIAQDLGYDIYQLVRDGEWTMDIFIEMVKKGATDVSGNQAFAYSEGDIIGWATTTHATHGLHAASGLPMITTTNGTMSFAMSNAKSEWTNVIEKAIEVWALPQHDNCGYSNGTAAIISGNTLFYSNLVATLEEASVRDSDTPIGLVPYPKYSTAQENYAHYVDNHLMTYSVPTSVVEIEELGDFFTVYAAHTTAIVRPAWIDAYAYEYCGDADSGEMLDIILNTRTYDPGYLIFSSFEGEISQQIDAGKNNITKLIDKRYDSIAGPGGSIENHIKAISDNKA